jgi:hypothetical protein
LASAREESTQIIMGKRLVVLDEPWLEVAVNNTGLEENLPGTTSLVVQID